MRRILRHVDSVIVVDERDIHAQWKDCILRIVAHKYIRIPEVQQTSDVD